MKEMKLNPRSNPKSPPMLATNEEKAIFSCLATFLT